MFFRSTIVAATMIAGSAAAQTVTAQNPDSVVRALQDLGYRAELTTDSTGDPMVRSSASGVGFSIIFYGCNDANQNCKWLMFFSGFDTTNAFTASRMNEWNTRKLFGTARIDEDGDPRLTYFLSTTGGVSQANFADVVDWWEIAMGQFTEFIDW